MPPSCRDLADISAPSGHSRIPLAPLRLSTLMSCREGCLPAEAVVCSDVLFCVPGTGGHTCKLAPAIRKRLFNIVPVSRPSLKSTHRSNSFLFCMTIELVMRYRFLCYRTISVRVVLCMHPSYTTPSFIHVPRCVLVADDILVRQRSMRSFICCV